MMAVRLVKYDWGDPENLPATGGIVVACNHVSAIDSLVVAHFLWSGGRYPIFLVKEKWANGPLLGRLLRVLGQVAVDRGTESAGRAVGEAAERLKQGECVVFFVEGTLTRDPGLWPMVAKTGAVRSARMAEVSILPLAVWGTHEVLWPYDRFPRFLPRRQIAVRLGEAIDAFGRQDANIATAVDARAVTDALTDRITETLQNIRDGSPPAVAVDPRTNPFVPIPTKPGRRTAPAWRPVRGWDKPEQPSGDQS
jgi:1-acyl-sn-glycerol-3-phosphate acyltransferase